MERKTIRVARNVAHPGHRFRMANMVSIICPNCGYRRLIDTSRFTVSDTFIPGQNGYESAEARITIRNAADAMRRSASKS